MRRSASVGAVVVLLLFVGGLALASDSGDVINTCVNSAGVMFVVDDPSECVGQKTPLSWSTSGGAHPDREVVSSTSFSITPEGCPPDQWRLQVTEQTGVAIPWNTSECFGILEQGPDAPSVVVPHAYADVNGLTELEGAYYHGDKTVAGVFTYLDDGMWHVVCRLNVNINPYAEWLHPGDTVFFCTAGVSAGNEARLAEVLNSEVLHSPPVEFLR